jgi:type IV secretory pathway VirB2 component (pilin)
MRKIILTIALSILTIGTVYAPLTLSYLQSEIAYAGAIGGNTGGTIGGNTGGTIGGNNGGTIGGNNGGTIGGQSCDPQTQLCNPLLSKYDTLCKVLEAILTLITQLGALIAVILIIWTGFKFITAQGSPNKLNDAKKAFLTTIIGTAILLGASVIAQIIVKTIFTITNQNNPGICQI